MKIVINSVEFENAEWNVNGSAGQMSFQTEESIIDVLTEIGSNQDIFVYDDEESLTSKWCNRGIQGVDKSNGTMSITFIVSILDDNAEELLQNGIDESVDAILELGELISNMDEELSEQKDKTEALETDMTAQKNKTQMLETDMTEQKQKSTTLETKMDKAQTDITSLENKFSSLPADIPASFAELWSRYNALADRVAQLENKL